LKARLAKTAFYGERVAVLPTKSELPRYFANVVIGSKTIGDTLRPLGGKLISLDGKLLETRGSLSGSTNYLADWKPSEDPLVQAPLGVLWFDDALSNFKRSPQPKVVDGIMIVRSEFDWQRDGKVYTEDPAQQACKACIVGLDAKTGKQAWKTELPNCLNTFSTPVVHVRADGKNEVICTNNASGVMGIDPTTGKKNWQYNPGFNQRSLGSGVLQDNRYFCTFGTGGGVKEFAAIDVSGNEPKPVPFEFSKGLPYVPSPLVMDDLMYLLGDGGILKVVDFKSGKQLYEERLNGSAGSSKFFSSPVAADGKFFAGSQQGDLIVVKAGPKFEQLSATKLDSPINASPAIGEGRLYVRTEKMLWCIGSKNQPVP
jgi:outer membrane protein assembly factor BamB